MKAVKRTGQPIPHHGVCHKNYNYYIVGHCLFASCLLFISPSLILFEGGIRPVHYRGCMDLVQFSGPWTRSEIGVHGPRCHGLSSHLILKIEMNELKL